jgi:hypothetical protein
MLIRAKMVTITLRRSSDGYVEACTFCKHYGGDWRNDFDNTNPLKESVYELELGMFPGDQMVSREQSGTSPSMGTPINCRVDHG